MNPPNMVLKIWERRRALLADEFRRNYYKAFDEIVQVLLETDDALVLYNYVRSADLNNPKEVAAAQQLIRASSSGKHQVTLRTLAQTQKAELLSTLREKRDLPESMRAALKPERPPRRSKS